MELKWQVIPKIISLRFLKPIREKALKPILPDTFREAVVAAYKPMAMAHTHKHIVTMFSQILNFFFIISPFKNRVSDFL